VQWVRVAFPVDLCALTVSRNGDEIRRFTTGIQFRHKLRSLTDGAVFGLGAIGWAALTTGVASSKNAGQAAPTLLPTDGRITMNLMSWKCLLNQAACFPKIFDDVQALQAGAQP
jgi:hypothetical protein